MNYMDVIIHRTKIGKRNQKLNRTFKYVEEIKFGFLPYSIQEKENYASCFCIENLAIKNLKIGRKSLRS